MGRKKKGKEKTEERSEFRKLNTREAKGHLHYVFQRAGKFFKSIGITHAKRTKGQKNMQLTKNPNPEDKEPAYARPTVTKEKAKDYGKRLDDHSLLDIDLQAVNELIKRLEQGEKKK